MKQKKSKPIAVVLYNLFKALGTTDKERKDLQRRIDKLLGFKPGSYEDYELALLHSSAANQQNGLRMHNERLEFLGDSVLDLVIADVLYLMYPEKDEGELTKLRSIIVNRSQLNRIATEFGIDKLIKGNFNKNVLPDDVKGNALEAIIGAIYKDKGFKFVYRFVRKSILEKHINFRDIKDDHRDYKSELFIWSQKERKPITFETVGDMGKGEKKKYIINCIIDGRVVGTGEGSSKKRAQQMACKNACKKLNLCI